MPIDLSPTARALRTIEILQARPGVTVLAGIRYISLHERLTANGSELGVPFESDVWDTRNSFLLPSGGQKSEKEIP